jgi:hypothetical protein
MTPPHPRWRLPLAFLALAMALGAAATPPAHAQTMQWTYYRDLHEDVFRTRLVLVYGVPETDNVQTVATCQIGAGGTYASLDLGAQIGDLQENQSVDVQFSARGFNRIVNASVIRAREEGLNGVSIPLQLDDPIWQAIRAKSVLYYNLTGFTAATLDLNGSKGPTQRFLRDCREMPKPGTADASPPRQTPPRTGRTTATNDPRWQTCDIYRGQRSRNSDVPVTVSFQNQSGATRGVMWIDFNGRPVDYANLAPGGTFTINTYMTHPWMFTDGPGNCIEMFMPQPGVTRFAITAPNRNFGPE